VSADLAAESGADQVIGAAIERFGRIDILVNNAGGGIIKPFLDHTSETMRETVDRNLWTTVHCCRAALPRMKSAGYGRIVNVGADSVRNGLFEHAMYNAAKGGVHGLTTGLAREFAPYGITVNTVAPTGTDTPTVLSRPPDAVERYRKTTELIPLGRFATVEEVASAVAYLAGDEARFITGQVLSVNGGTAML
jgi:2,3-dihydroxy-2,3-dihydro-p-cumate dehydrogenase